MTKIHEGVPNSDLGDILEHSRSIFPKLAESRLLILGGTGFVGTWLVSSLLHANRVLDLNLQITVLTRSESLANMRLQGGVGPALRIVEVDLQRDDDQVSGEFTHLVHAATPSSPSTGGLDADYVTAVSLNGAAYLLKKAESQNVVPIMLHVSSGAVYGPQKIDSHFLVEETAELKESASMTPYARAKLEVERLVAGADRSGIIRGTNPRLFAFCGPYIALDAHFAVGNFVHDALYSDKIRLKGNPSTVRSYLYPTDMVTWLIACLANPTLQPLHIGSDSPIEMIDAARTISKLTRGIPVTEGDESAPISRYVPSTIQTREYLGVEQRVTFEEGVKRWVNWLKR